MTRQIYKLVANIPIELPWAKVSTGWPDAIGTLNKNYATGEWEISDPEGNRILRFRMDDYEVCRLVDAPEPAPAEGRSAYEYRMTIILRAADKMPGMSWAEARALAMDEIAAEWGMVGESNE